MTDYTELLMQLGDVVIPAKSFLSLSGCRVRFDDKHGTMSCDSSIPVTHIYFHDKEPAIELAKAPVVELQTDDDDDSSAWVDDDDSSAWVEDDQ